MADNKKILIVEDDPEIAEYCALLLEHMGYSIVGSTAFGGDAIALAKTTEIDLALVDISLSDDLDGIEVCTQLKEQCSISTVFLSSADSKEVLNRAKKSRPLAFLIKPIRPRELELAIDLALSQVETTRKLEQSEFHFAQAQEIANLGSWDWDIKANALHWTDQIYRTFGLKPQEFGATYESFLEFVHPDDVEQVNDSVNRALNGDGPYEVQHRIIPKNGKQKIVIERGDVVFNMKGEPVRMYGTVQDISELYNAQEQIKHLAYYDAITGLPNRNLFFDRLDQSLALQRREDKTFAVLAIDLDGFKKVNDTYGHMVGDALLKEVAKRLKKNIRDVDIVARTGGDEFMAIIWGLINVSDVEVVARKLVTACDEPFQVGNAKLDISCSIGISICPDHSVKDSQLVKLADDAMYSAKKAGKNDYKIYDSK